MCNRCGGEILDEKAVERYLAKQKVGRELVDNNCVQPTHKKGQLLISTVVAIAIGIGSYVGITEYTSNPVENTAPVKHFEGVKVEEDVDISGGANQFLEGAYTLEDKIGERSGQPSEMFMQEDVRLLLTNIFDKPMEQMTWEDIDQISYLDIGVESYGEWHESDKNYKALSYRMGEGPVITYSVSNQLVSELTTSQDLALFHGVKELNIEYFDTMPFEQLQGMTQLERLYIRSCEGLETLDQLSTFPSLNYLSIKGESWLALKGIGQLPSLTTLELQETSITDWSSLQGNQMLKTLVVNDNKVLVDIATIATVTTLEHLTLIGENVAYSSELQSLIQLKELVLEETLISDLEFMRSLGQLESLTLVENDNIRNTDPLWDMGSLRKLTMCEEYAPVPVLTQLTYFDMVALYDVADMAPLTSLETLILRGGDMEHLDVLKDFNHLETLIIDNTTYTSSNGEDMAFLFNMPSLKHLELIGGQYHFTSFDKAVNSKVESIKIQDAVVAYDFEVMSDGMMTSMDYTPYTGDQVAKGIAQIETLKDVTLTDLDIMSVEPFIQLQGLERLNLNENKIIDITPLNGHQTLKSVSLNENLLQDVTPLGTIEGLENVSLHRTTGIPAEQVERLAKTTGVIWQGEE